MLSEGAMKKVNYNDIEWTQRRSPNGTYELGRRELSVELGCPRHVGPWGGGHPFDVELSRLAPGKTNWPLHSHAAQYEFYIILAGRGMVREGEETSEVSAGDCFIIPPGVAHNMTNTGDEDLLYYIIADNQPADVVSYPGKNKLFLKPGFKTYAIEETGYYDPGD